MRQPIPPLELPPRYAHPVRRAKLALLKQRRQLGRRLEADEHARVVLGAVVIGGRQVIDALTDRQRCAIVDAVEIQGDRGAVIDLGPIDEMGEEQIPELRYAPARLLRRLATMDAAPRASRLPPSVRPRPTRRAPRGRRSRTVSAVAASPGDDGPPSPRAAPRRGRVDQRNCGALCRGCP